MDVQYLWIQEEVAEGRLKVDKVGTKESPADILTVAVGRDVMLRHLQALGIELSNTRAVKAPELDGFQFFYQALNSSISTILETSRAVERGKSEPVIFQSSLREPTGMPNPKAMTAGSRTESAGKFEASRAKVLVPWFFPCAGTDMPFRIVFNSSVVLVFLAVLFSSLLRTFPFCAHRLVDMTVHARRFDRFGSRHTLRKTVTRICHVTPSVIVKHMGTP